MRLKLLSAVTVLLVTACSVMTTDLSYRNGQLALQLDHTHLQVPVREISQKRENFSTLMVTHYLLALEKGELVVFDKARTDTRYEFYYPTAETIRIVFEARAVRQVYFSNSLYVFQVILADGTLLNVIAEQLEDESLNLLYGMSNTTLEKLMKKLHGTPLATLHTPVRTIRGKEGAIFSKWTIRKVNVMQLVGPKREMMGF